MKLIFGRGVGRGVGGYMPGAERGSAGHKGPQKTPNCIEKNRVCMLYARFI